MTSLYGDNERIAIAIEHLNRHTSTQNMKLDDVTVKLDGIIATLDAMTVAINRVADTLAYML